MKKSKSPNKELLKKAVAEVEEMIEKKEPTKQEITSRGVSLPVDLDRLLFALALARKQKHGGRLAVSNIISECVESCREKLENELHELNR
jgi:hypothetical protein